MPTKDTFIAEKHIAASIVCSDSLQEKAVSYTHLTLPTILLV